MAPTTLMAMHAFALTEHRKYELLAQLMVPVCCCTFILSMFSFPRCDALHKRLFLWFSFISFVVGCEGFGAYSEFHREAEKKKKGKVEVSGINWIGIQSVIRLLIWIVLFYNLLKLRKKVAKLPVKELSNFVLNTILTRGLAALLPMIFFSFETLSCFSVYSLNVRKVCRR